MKSRIFLKAMLASAVFSIFLTVFLCHKSEVSANGKIGSAVSNQSFGIEEDETYIFDLVNEERRKKGLSKLFWDEKLSKMARTYSKQMARENFFSHYDSDGKSVIERAEKSRINDWRKIGENLFYCEGMSDYQSTAVKGWLHSPSHRQNMFDRNWTDSGIGIAKSRDGKIYVTQVFVKR